MCGVLQILIGSWSAELQVDAAVVAHGSKMTPELLGEVRKPALFLQPEHDQQMNPELLEHVNKVPSADMQAQL